MKYCKDCKHLTYDSPFRLCTKSIFENDYDDPVIGSFKTREYNHCYLERTKEGGCGPDAKFFEAKPTLLGKLKELMNKCKPS